MPTIQWTIPSEKVTVTKNMPAPTKVTELWKGWYKSAQKYIPQIPHVPESKGSTGTLWSVLTHSVDRRWIRFDLVDVQGTRGYLVIDRSGPSM